MQHNSAPVSVGADHMEAIPGLVLAAHSKGHNGGQVAGEVVSPTRPQTPGLLLRELLKANCGQTLAGLLCNTNQSTYVGLHRATAGSSQAVPDGTAISS